MLSGSQVSSSIDGALVQAQKEAAVMDREVSHLTNRLIQLTEDEGQVYQLIARVRLDSIRSGKVIRLLSAADHRARELVEMRQGQLDKIDGELGEAQSSLSELSRQRSECLKQVEVCQREASVSEASVREALLQSEEYVGQRTVAERAAETARFATQKTELAEKDRVIKGKPYEDDRLFCYLWERRYGTSDYHANPFSRMMDGLVAKVCGYRAAAANYNMLLEIPKRLASHAERLREQVEDEARELAEVEHKALESGESGVRRKALRESKATLDKLEDQLELAEQKVTKLSESRNRLARGDDELTQEALGVLESAMRTSELQELMDAALGTPAREDDAAVRRLESIVGERRKIQAALENQKSLQLSHARRMNELEQVRREYRRGGYVNDAWDFRSGDMLSVLLGEMLRGAITRDTFWDNMRRHQRPTSPFDVSISGGTFQWPGSRGGGGGLDDLFSGRSSGGSDWFGGGGGDFRSGGGF